MFSRLLSVIILMSFFSFHAAANSKPAEGEGEAKKEEAKSEGKDEYAEAQNAVATLQAKIKAGEESVKKLIEEKQHTKSAAQTAEIIKNLVTQHKELEKNIADYEKARSYLQYRFPEKGLKGKRTYERFELRSIEEMEHEMTMETRLKKTLGKVRKQYGEPEPRDKEVPLKKSNKPKPEENPAVAEPVILSK